MMAFRVSQKVVCIDARKCRGRLVKGSIYTVSGFDLNGGIDLLGRHSDFGLLLSETDPCPGHSGFSPRRFRPVKTTSIELFRAMLVTPPKVRTPA